MAFYRIAQKRYNVQAGNMKEEWVWHSALFRDLYGLTAAVQMLYRNTNYMIFGATTTDRLEESLRDFNNGELVTIITPIDFLAGRFPFDDAAIVKGEQVVDNQRVVDAQENSPQRKTEKEGADRRRLEFYKWMYQQGKINEGITVKPIPDEQPEEFLSSAVEGEGG